jgi:hypothetical protein
MKYIQKGHVDDKTVSQLLQVHQTFGITCDFLWNFYITSSINQTIVFEEEIEGESNEKKQGVGRNSSGFNWEVYGSPSFG